LCLGSLRELFERVEIDIFVYALMGNHHQQRYHKTAEFQRQINLTGIYVQNSDFKITFNERRKHEFMAR
jgi:DNA repair exonuclease SbcCD nuclease subunit